VWLGAVLLAPDSESGNGFGGQGRGALLSTLPVQRDMRASAELHVAPAGGGELGHPQSCLDGGEQQRVVAAADPAGASGAASRAFTSGGSRKDTS